MDSARLVLAVLATTLGGAGLLAWLVVKLLRALAGPGLVARYGAAAEPPGVRHDGQTIAIGAVRHRRSGRVVIGPAGLYAKGAVLGGAVLVPWSEISAVRPAAIFLRPAMELCIGNPRVGSITVYPDLFEPMRPYLGAVAGPREPGPRPAVLFATPCRWIKFDLDPDAPGDRSTPLRGTLRVGPAGLEFSGYYKSYGGTLLAGLISAWFVRGLGEIRQTIPLDRLRRVAAIRFTSRFLFIEVEAVRLEVLYAGEGPAGLRKMVCFPHFGLAPPRRPGTRVLAPELAHLYRSGDAEACNWERVLRHLAGLAE